MRSPSPSRSASRLRTPPTTSRSTPRSPARSPKPPVAFTATPRSTRSRSDSRGEDLYRTFPRLGLVEGSRHARWVRRVAAQRDPSTLDAAAGWVSRQFVAEGYRCSPGRDRCSPRRVGLALYLVQLRGGGVYGVDVGAEGPEYRLPESAVVGDREVADLDAQDGLDPSRTSHVWSRRRRRERTCRPLDLAQHLQQVVP